MADVIKKKGRKPKSYYLNLNNDLSNNLNNDNTVADNVTTTYNVTATDDVTATDIKIPKKRGRKPKGGKIVENKNVLFTALPKSNIILHLNCNLIDIYNINTDNYMKYEPNINEIKNYNIDNKILNYNFLNSDSKENGETNTSIDTFINPNNTQTNEQTDELNNTAVPADNLEYKKFIYNISNVPNNVPNNVSNNVSNNVPNNVSNNVPNIEPVETAPKYNSFSEMQNAEKEFTKKNISKKLKELAYNLKYNNIIKKNSACFWCTCNFDNEIIHIPKNEINDKYMVYGCFCSPECACSYLMNENIDSSTKFERYYLLNNIYGKIYEYNKNIKPAPDPRYLLDKFYGNLDIQEYRKLLENERLLLIMNKPLSCILPEIYEENDDYLINSKIISKK